MLNKDIVVNIFAFLFGAHWAYLSLFADYSLLTFIPRAYPRPPLPLHPCVQCEILKENATHPTKRQLPLEFCGYGKSNFSWIEYGHGCAGNKDDFFAGLGFLKLDVPSYQQVRERVNALRRIWNSSESDFYGKQEVPWSTGLTWEQLISIELKLHNMEEKMNYYREHKTLDHPDT